MVFKSHPYHIVQLSPWPLLGSMAGLVRAVGFIIILHKSYTFLLSVGVILLLLIIIIWWRDVVRERTYRGSHTKQVQTGLRYGMLLFISSEVMFFIAFFWAFFHRRLAPTREIGCSWPPRGVSVLNPLGVPLLNTGVLLTSGATVTWAHYGVLNNYRCELSWGLGVTVFLGLYFSYLQISEYLTVSYSISDSVFGSTFFVATGFHGLHVLIGTSFLFVCWARALGNHYSSEHHKGLEFAAWYWHFVDVVWIFLYIFLYWWSV